MFHRRAVLTARVAGALFLCLAGLAGAATAPFTTKVPDKAAVRDRHTLLLANFDSAASNDAHYARFDRRAQTNMTRMDVPGRFGKGVAFSQPPLEVISKYVSLIVYDAQSNWNPLRGALSFWVKSPDGKNIWRDDKPYNMVYLRVRPDKLYKGHLGDSIAVKKTGKGQGSRIGLTLQSPSRGAKPAQPQFGVLCAQLDPAQWHHVFVSWDLSEGGAYWLAVDGKGGRWNTDPPLKKGWARPGFKIQVGGSHLYSDAADFALDDLVITDQSPRSLAEIEKRRAKGWERINQAKLMKVEDAARRWLDLLIRIQHKGTWAPDYAWPTLQPWNSRPRYIQHVEPRNLVNLAKGAGTAGIAAQFMSAYRFMSDRSCLDACRRTGDFLVGVQKMMGGGWPGYPVEIQPNGKYLVTWAPDLISIQEFQQLGAAVLLAQLCYQTGEKRYRDAFRWSCDTMIQAQNPCGAWSGGYHLKGKHVGGHGYSWINDETELGGFFHMILAYQVLKDKKYWDAAIRSSDWLIRAQVKSPVGWGWAQQYDKDDKPCWGRTYGHASEPPAICTRESREACLQLALTYDMTADPKYLGPIRKYADFVDNCGFHDLGLIMYFDLKTGKPIVAYNRDVYFEEDLKKAPPKVIRLLKGQYGYAAIMKRKPPDGEKIRSRYLRPRRNGPVIYRTSSMRNVLSSAVRGLKSREANRLLAAQHACGAWIGESGGTGPCFSALGRQLTNYLLPAIKHARVALGELPLDAIHRWSRYLPDVAPSIDYQDTPALKARGWTRDQKTKQLFPPPKILKGALGR